jgi:acetoin utilization deacetylase AcuC-like enzyme
MKKNIKEKVLQRSQQPENSDRVTFLTDAKIGLLTNGYEFAKSSLNQYSSKDCIDKANLVDILKIHDFHYIQKVIKHIEKLEGTENKMVSNFDGQGDTAASERSWEAALVSAGAAIEAVDQVMSGNCRNAFCATRPPGHHAGIFGKTFH